MTDPILGAPEPPIAASADPTPHSARDSSRDDLSADPYGRDFSDAPLEVLEDDETIPPRPEEELADLERSDPAPH